MAKPRGVPHYFHLTVERLVSLRLIFGTVLFQLLISGLLVLPPITALAAKQSRKSGSSSAVCSDLLEVGDSSVNESIRSQELLDSLSSIFEYALEHQWITAEKLSEFANSTQEKVKLEIQSMAVSNGRSTFRTAALTLLADLKSSADWLLFQQRIAGLLVQQESVEKKREASKETTRTVHEAIEHKIIVPTASRYPRSSQWFREKNGDFLMAVSVGPQVIVYNGKKFGDPIHLRADSSVTTEATWFQDKNGDTLVAFGTIKNRLYVYNLKKPSVPIIYETEGGVFTQPAWHTEPNGRVLIAVGTQLNHLYIFDLKKKRPVTSEHLDSYVGNSPRWHVTPDGSSEVGFATNDGSIYILPADPLNKIKKIVTGIQYGLFLNWYEVSPRVSYLIGGYSGALQIFDGSDLTLPPLEIALTPSISSFDSYPPEMLVTQDNRHLIAIGLEDGTIQVLDLNDLKKAPLIYQAMIAPGHGFVAGTWHVTAEGRTLYAVTDLINTLYIFDLNDFQHPQTFNGISGFSKPAWFLDADGKSHVSVVGKDKVMHLIDLDHSSAR